MAQITVMVLLNHLKQLQASSQVNNDQLPTAGLAEQVQWLCSQFEIMLKFLMNFEDDNCHRDAVRQLVDGISGLAHESEDVVDKYVSDFVKHRKNCTEPFAPDMDHTMELDNLREMIDRIISRIGYMDANRCEFGIICKKAVDVPKQQALSRRTKAWVAEENVTMGLTEHCKRLVDRLIKGHDQVWFPRREDPEVIGIVGEGGTGKTTLAYEVYNDVLVKKYFELRGWVLVSNNYTLRNLLLSILSGIMVITDHIYGMEVWELKRKLVNQLSGHRYLIVMDDVWNHLAWNELKDAFPTSKAGWGSRIIITTRSIHSLPKQGPEFALGFEVKGKGNYQSRYARNFMLRSLGKEESWELFSKKIFGKERCPENLKILGRIIVESCGGRPLVIVTAACILRASEITVSRWSNIISRITGKRSSSYSNASSDILSVCYTDMPQHLKACFLYLGVFPEDTEIYVKQLIQLWIAEGLIPAEEKANRRMEDVAEDYLEGLIGRNLIKVTKRRSDGGAKSCRIHDILRDLCINLSEKERFLKVHTGGCHSTQREPRRLSILSDGQEYISNSNTFSSSRVLRSFSCFSQDIHNILEKDWELLFEQCPLLRVLNLMEGEVGKLSKTIAELFHLRYLRVKPTKNFRVPKSIFNHRNLQTIDLRTIQFPELPKGIWKMHQLTHLYLDGPSRLPETESEECLPNLQTLSYISNDDDICISKKVPNLRKLGLYDYYCSSKSEQDVTFNLPHLQSLKFAKECTFEGLEDPIKLPTTITKITVKKAHLQLNAIKMFEVLPNLHILKFVQTSFDDDELVFGENSFPKLKWLKFEDSNIVTWRLEKGAIPNLHSLVINKCHLLTELPAELWEANKLKKLELFWASPTLAKKLEALTENKGLKLVIHSTSSA